MFVRGRNLAWACIVGLALPVSTICLGSSALSGIMPRGRSAAFVARSERTTWTATRRTRPFYETLVYVPLEAGSPQGTVAMAPGYLFGSSVDTLAVSKEDTQSGEVVWRIRSGVVFSSFDSVVFFDTISTRLRIPRGAVSFGEWVIPYVPTRWIVADFVFVSLVSLVLQEITLQLRAMKRRRNSRCVHCGYPLNDTLRCPECGNPKHI